MKQVVVLVTGRAAVVPRDDIDTDAILPAQYLKAVTRRGMGAFLFADWVAAGNPCADFVRSPMPVGILVAGRNFGCGSSREHAVWALADYGIQAILALSFGDIFRSNCVKNDVLAATLSPRDHQALTSVLRADAVLQLDVPSRTLSVPDGPVLRFELLPGHAEQLMSSEDDIARTLRLEYALAEYEQRVAVSHPWLTAMR
jgi:3-isopropylmalate/(R)-2-methylmalate dehydratase small subunit